MLQVAAIFVSFTAIFFASWGYKPMVRINTRWYDLCARFDHVLLWR